jgi:hypothetical protein
LDHAHSRGCFLIPDRVVDCLCQASHFHRISSEVYSYTYQLSDRHFFSYADAHSNAHNNVQPDPHSNPATD